MGALQRTTSQTGGVSYWFWCSGCDTHHRFVTSLGKGETGPVWSFDGNEDSPTFSPSLLCNRDNAEPEVGVHRCHLFLRNGVVEYLSDCTHELAGHKVPVESPRF